MRISPASGVSRPMICLSSTLLPLPLGPMMTKISPGLTSKSIPLSTSCAPKFLRRSRTCTLTPFWAGWVAGGEFILAKHHAGQGIIPDHDEHDAVDDGPRHRTVTAA